MKWTEHRKTPYDHVLCHTPLGEIEITWKSWKQHPYYTVIMHDEYVDCSYSLEKAKKIAKNYLQDKARELNEFLK